MIPTLNSDEDTEYFCAICGSECDKEELHQYGGHVKCAMNQ